MRPATAGVALRRAAELVEPDRTFPRQPHGSGTVCSLHGPLVPAPLGGWAVLAA
jgi:hypothetical protein